MEKEVYLDYAATTPPNQEVKKLYFNLLETNYANSESKHEVGFRAKLLLDKARQQIASILDVKHNNVIFTSSGSEANNLAIKGIAFAYQNRGKHIITTQIEHPSVYECINQLLNLFGFSVSYVKLKEDGSVDLEDLKNLLNPKTILVSIMAVNNELGIINDINQIANIVKKESKAFVHVDAVQAIGKENIDFKNVDLYTFSSHKIYGLKGMGVLIKKDNINLEPLIVSGEQEFKLRGGTSDYSKYASGALALRLINDQKEENYKKVSQINSYLKDSLNLIEEIEILTPNNGSVYILSFYVKNKKAEVLLTYLSSYGIYVSSKSACSSYDKSYSRSVYHVFNDLGKAKNLIRVSLSSLTTKEEIDYFILILKQAIKELR